MHAQQLQQLQLHQQMASGFFVGAPGYTGAGAAPPQAHHAAMGGYGLSPMARFPVGGYDPQLAAQQLSQALAAQHASASASAAAAAAAAAVQGGADPVGADAQQQQPLEGAPPLAAPSGPAAPPPT